MVGETTKPILIPHLAKTIKIVRATTITEDTESVPMTTVVITGATTIKDTGMPTTAIGGLGSNGMTTQEKTRTYTDMVIITVKMHI